MHAFPMDKTNDSNSKIPLPLPHHRGCRLHEGNKFLNPYHRALSLFFSPSSAKTLKDRLFPTIEVTLSNQSGDNIYHLCNFNSSQRSFNLLPKGEKVSWQFRQHLFPTRWCYLYLNDEKHGFFWAYTVRLKCKECAWKITNGPYIYRRRVKIWELAYLHPIPGTSFDPDGPDQKD